MVFFPEWTDHGVAHIQDVLTTATALISDEAWLEFTPADAAALIIAVICHDIAMYLSEDGFVELSRSNANCNVVPGDRAWCELWEQFWIATRKYGGNPLDGICVHGALADPATWTGTQRRVIGDQFLRVHHGKLAHQVALCGLPAVDGESLGIIDAITPEMRDIGGLIARSHTMQLRDCLPYMKRNYDVREYQKIHAVFLMALLRVADYLQIQAERAPGDFLKTVKLRSRRSRREWDTHDAVRDVRQSHEDPRAMFVHALPKSVTTWSGIKRWLRGIQSELDASWEVLDELNGRFDGLKRLTMTIRRVRSNLDDSSAFAQSVSYVPAVVRFRIADSEVLKRLVGPLYGDSPSIGVRELVQNAVDAVLELRSLDPAKQVRGIDGVDADVLVTLEKGADGVDWLHVEDRGIGMTVDVIQSYFLVAGKSYRESEQWKAAFLDERGASSVMRTGRFGVGALSAFLLGDEIQVTTRNANSDTCVRFSASLSRKMISLDVERPPIGALRPLSLPVGTRLSVKLRRRERIILETEQDVPIGEYSESWDWYCLSDPKVIRRVKQTDNAMELSQFCALPGADTSVELLNEKGFHQLAPEKIGRFAGVHWTYNRQLKRGSRKQTSLMAFGGLVCNGIAVKAGPLFTKEWRLPFISVFDANAELPLAVR